MKKTLSVLLTASMLAVQVTGICTYAEENENSLTIGNITYTLNDKELLVDYDSTAKSWTNPKYLNLNGKLYTNGDITKIVFSDNVKIIPDEALAGCSDITEIVLGNNLLGIGKSAFMGTGISSIVLPETLKRVSTESFLNCTSLKDISVETTSVEFGTNCIGYTYDGESYNVIDDVVIKAPSESSAEAYAKYNNIKFESTSPAPSTQPENKYSITYVVSDGTLSYNAPQSYISGEELTLPRPIRSGYDFSGWFIDTNDDGVPDTKINKISKSQTGDITLYATWAKQYTIDYVLNGGTVDEEALVPFFSAIDDYIELPVPTKENCTFDGWYLNPSDKKSKVTSLDTKIASNVTLTALWTEPHTITYVLDGGTISENAKKTFTVNTDTITLETPTKQNYLFEGWYIDDDGDGIAESKISRIEKGTDKNITVYAMWSQGIKVTYVLNGGTNFENAPTVITPDTETVILGTPTKDNALFMGWSTDTNGDGMADTQIKQLDSTIKSDIILFADWKEVCSISYELNGGNFAKGTTPPESYTSGGDKKVALPIPERGGYVFKGWYLDEHFVEGVEEITPDMTGNITLYATWKRRNSQSLGGAVFTVKFNSCGGTSVKSQTVPTRTTAEKPETPTYKGYTFAGWYKDKNYTEKFNFSTPITAYTELFAKWIKNGEEEEHYTEKGDIDVLMTLTIGSNVANLNGKRIMNDVSPVIKNNRTMMPIRFIAEALGADVEWDAKFRIVTITLDERQIVIHIDSDVAYVNGSIYNLDSPAYISFDRTFIPVRFVSEALDCDVDWDEDTQKVTITK